VRPGQLAQRLLQDGAPGALFSAMDEGLEPDGLLIGGAVAHAEGAAAEGPGVLLTPDEIRATTG